MSRASHFKISLIALISIVGLAFMWGLYSYLLEDNFKTAEDSVRSSIIKWNYDISDRLYKKTDLGFVKKKIEDLSSKPLASYEIKIKGENTSFLKWPENEKQAESCRSFSEVLNITGGIQIGDFNFCISKSRIIWKTIKSPALIFNFLFLFISIVLISSVIPLMSFRSALKYIVEFFSDKNKNIADLKYTKDKLTNKVISIVKNSFKNEIDMNHVKVELTAEKRLNDIAESVAHDSEKEIRKLKNKIYLYSKSHSEENLALIDESIHKIEKIYGDLKSDEINKYTMRLNKPELLNMKPILKDVVQDHAAANSHIKITLKLQKDDLKAICHKDDFRRVLDNLITNSIEAISHKKGKIEVNATKESSHFVLAVTDNGKGIPKDITRYIFENKYTYGKKDSGGTGIGLYSVKKKIYSWLGSIDVTSTEGKGTTFTIKLKNEEAYEIEPPINQQREMTL